MIRWSPVGRVMGLFLMAFGTVMGFSFLYSLVLLDIYSQALAISTLITLATGGVNWLVCRHRDAELSQREGILLVVSTWLAACLFGSIPYLLTPHFGSLTDAVFETVSGFTATGASVLEDVESLPAPILLWRAITNWLGGMGIVVLVIAILPLVGHGGMHLYRAEFSGAKSEKLRPRIAETASSLWKIYLALTVAAFAALKLSGMNHFEALAHAFTLTSTAGFSTRTASIAGFDNPAMDYIIVIFMILGGISFIQHYRFFIERRPGSVFKDFELRMYLVLLATASVVVSLLLIFQNGYGIERAFRIALFQVTSIMTTTGYVIDDYELWPPLGQLILLVFMFVGGCTGSTAGGMKIARIALLTKVVSREFKRMVERHGVFAVRLGGGVVPETTIQSLLNLVYLAFLINFISCLVLAGLGVDVFTSIAAVAASMFNIGPALGNVGPLDHYGHLPALAKWVLSFDMLAGRLEYYTLLVIMTPLFWRK